MGYTFNKAALRKRVHAGCVKALDETVILVQREMRLTLSKPGTGRIYRVRKGESGGRNKREQFGLHQASAPGHPPAANTSNLRRSWQVGQKDNFISRRRINHPLRPTLSLGSSVKYARALQYGYGKLKPRPYVDVAVKSAKKGNKIDRIFDRQIAKAVAGR